EPRTDRREGVVRLALVPLALALELELALRHVVDHAVARDVVERIGLLDVFRPPADHHAELDLPVGLCRSARDLHVVVRAADRARRLEEQDRFGRHRHAALGRMVGIVQPDAHDLADRRDARTEPLAGGDLGQRAQVEPRELREALRGQLPEVDVAHLARQVADPAVGIDDARLLPTGGAMTKQFHYDSTWTLITRSTGMPRQSISYSSPTIGGRTKCQVSPGRIAPRLTSSSPMKGCGSCTV